MRFKIDGFKDNKKITAFIESTSKDLALQNAINKGIYPINIKESSNEIAELFKKVFSRPPNALNLSQDLALLSIMLDSALPIKEAFISLKNTTSNPTLANMYASILDGLDSGKSLQDALNPFSSIFSQMGIALLQSGIKSGKLPLMLKTLSEYFEHISTMRSNIAKALFYPIFVCASALCAFVFIAYFVIPQFSQLFLSFGANLPFSTQSLIFISQFLQDFGLYVALFLACLGAFITKNIREKNQNNSVYLWLNKAILHTPIFGKIILYRDLWAYFLSFLHLYEAGIDFSTTLKISLDSIQNQHLKIHISPIIRHIQNGETLYEAFASTPYIEDNIKHFLAIAQKSGELSKMLNLCVKYYKNKYEHLSAKILAYIEPFSTIIIALLVGWLAFGIFLPIWELGSVGF